MDVLLAQEHSMAAHGGDGTLRGDTGAGTPLAEHHCNGLAGQRALQLGGSLASLDGLLVRVGIANQCRKLCGCEVLNG